MQTDPLHERQRKVLSRNSCKFKAIQTAKHDREPLMSSDAIRHSLKRFGRIIFDFGKQLIPALIVLAVMLIAIQIAANAEVEFFHLFPQNITIDAAQKFLAALVNIDGILLGFFALVYATMLTALESTHNLILDLYQKLSKDAYENEKNPPDRAKYEGNMKAVRARRNNLLFLMILATLFLVWSILWGLVRLTSGVLSSADLANLMNPLFLAVGIFVFSIWYYTWTIKRTSGSASSQTA